MLQRHTVLIWYRRRAQQQPRQRQQTQLLDRPIFRPCRRRRQLVFRPFSHMKHLGLHMSLHVFRTSRTASWLRCLCHAISVSPLPCCSFSLSDRAEIVLASGMTRSPSITQAPSTLTPLSTTATTSTGIAPRAIAAMAANAADDSVLAFVFVVLYVHVT